MLCQGCYIVSEVMNEIIIFYITRELKRKNVIKENGDIDYMYLENDCVAYVIAFLQDNAINIGSLYAKEKGTRQGTFVLKSLCEFVRHKFPRVKYVELDDSTGVNPPKNIYYKLGFNVKDEVSDRYIKWDTWLNKYKHIDNPSEERQININTLLKNLK